MEFDPGELLYLRRSAFQSIEVSQSNGLRLLRTDRRAVQSALDLARPERLVLPYMQAMLSGLLFQAPPDSVLLLGLGGGDLMRFLLHHLPQSTLHAVEIDSTMVEVARNWFALPESGKISVQVEDAAAYLGQSRRHYDLLLVDIYGGEQLPTLFFDEAFYQHCHERLRDSGMLALNLLTDDAGSFRDILQRLRARFDRNTLCLTVPGHLNVIVLAFKQRPTGLSKPALSARAMQLWQRFGLDFDAGITELFSTNPTVDGELLF